MERVKLEKTLPPFEVPIFRWAKKVALSQLWRCVPDYDLSDFISEARLSYCIVVNRYPNVTKPGHFGALFRRTYLNRLSSIAVKRPKKVGIPFTTLIGTDGRPDDAFAVELARDGMSQVELEMHKKEAPPHIANILTKLVDAKERPAVQSRGKRKESLSDYLCRIAGVEAGRDIVGEILEWLERPVRKVV